MVLQQVNAIATESGEFRDRHAAEHLQVLDGMLKIWFGPYGNAEFRANRA